MALKPLAPRAAATAAPKTAGSRWDGIESTPPKLPILGKGTYRVRVIGCVETVNPGKGSTTFKATLSVVDALAGATNAAGDSVVVLEMTSGKAAQSGMGRVKAFVIAAAGFSDQASFNAYTPDGGFIDAVLGVANEFSARGDTINGRLVDVEVAAGNATADGADYYRVYSWSAVDDTEQDPT